MGWKESKVSHKRRKKIEFDITLLQGTAKRRGIGLTPVRSKNKRGDKAIPSHRTDITDIALVGDKKAKKPTKEIDSPAVLGHEKQMKKHLGLSHPIMLMCRNCGLEGLQSEWVKREENKQSKPKLACPRCRSSEYRKME